jgi:glycosyltransferase involved in cell wall biosynthesis
VPAAPIKLLFATRTSPFAGDSGSGAYVFDLLQYLGRNGFCIHIVWTEPPDLVPSRGWYAQPKESRAVFSLELMNAVKIGHRYWKPDVVWLPIKARASHAVKTVLRRLGLWREKKTNHSASISPIAQTSLSPQWGSACTPTEAAAIHKAIYRFRPDVVLANYAWMAPGICDVRRRHPPCAVLTHDVRHRQLHLVNGLPVEILGEHMSAETEFTWLQSTDALIAIQQIEAKVFARLLPDKRIVTAPLSVRPRPLPVPEEPTVIFVGSQHGPNVAGLRWFIENVWPLVRLETPSARLLVAGTVCKALQSPQPAGVEVLGRLPDLSTAYSRASVVIAPILQGSGVKIKILEAVSFGRACVTTSVGLEGLEALQPALRVADTPETFAAEVVQLLKPPAAKNAGAQILALAQEHLSVKASYEPVANLLRDLASETT